MSKIQSLVSEREEKYPQLLYKHVTLLKHHGFMHIWCRIQSYQLVIVCFHPLV